MDEIIKTVSEKAGINTEQAQKAVHAVFDFVKEKVPMVGDHLKGLLEGGGNKLGDIVGKIGGILGGK